MVAASIVFSQDGVSGSAGVAMLGVKSLEVTCSNSDDTGVASRLWTLKSVPLGSALTAGTEATSATFAFTPDVDHCYLVRLVVTGGDGSIAVDERVFGVPNSDDKLVPAFQGSGSAHNFTGNARGWSGSGTVKMLDWMLANGTLPNGTAYQHIERSSDGTSWQSASIVTIPEDSIEGSAILKVRSDSWFEIQFPNGIGIYGDEPEDGDESTPGKSPDGIYIESSCGGYAPGGEGGDGAGLYVIAGSAGDGATGGVGGEIFIASGFGGINGTSTPYLHSEAGDVSIYAGMTDNYANRLSSGGNMLLHSSAGGPVAGTIQLVGGKNVSPVDVSPGAVAGEISVIGGACTHGDGGSVDITGGNSTYVNGGGFTGDLYGGSVNLKGGDITGTTRTGFSAGGSVYLEGGAGHEGYGGDIIIQPGSGTSAHGAVYLITKSGGTSTVYLTASILEATPAGFRTNEVTGKLEYRHRGGTWAELP